LARPCSNPHVYSYMAYSATAYPATNLMYPVPVFKSGVEPVAGHQSAVIRHPVISYRKIILEMLGLFVHLHVSWSDITHSIRHSGGQNYQTERDLCTELFEDWGGVVPIIFVQCPWIPCRGRLLFRPLDIRPLLPRPSNAVSSSQHSTTWKPR